MGRGGRPIHRAAFAKLDKHEDEILDMVGEGQTADAIAGAMGVSRTMLYKWRKKRVERWEAAKRDSAEAHAEAAGQVLVDARDDESMTPAKAAVVRSLSGWHTWMASVRDREQFGAGPPVAVNVTVGELHLDALRSASRPPLPSWRELREAHVVEEEDDGDIGE